MTASDYLHTWAPFDVVDKSGEDASPHRGRISGFASSEAQDADGEIVVQKGLDWSWFLEKGFISLEHPLGVNNIVGEPVSVQLVKSGDDTAATRIEADLLLEDPNGRSIWEKARCLKKSGGKRRLGFSIEGRVTERDGSTIKKAKVMSVAISPAPKNPRTWFEPIMASMLWRSMMGTHTGAAMAGVPGQGVTRDQGFSGNFPPLVSNSPNYEVSSASFDSPGSGPTGSLSAFDTLVASILKNLPQMTWAQGQEAIQLLLQKQK
jgi:hypothetical protein